MYNKLNASAKSYKFHFYSGHDTTIALMLNALHYTSTECLLNAFLNKTVDCVISQVNSLFQFFNILSILDLPRT